MRFFICAVKYVFKAHSSGKLTEVSWRLVMFSLVTGVGMNFKPRDSEEICSSVNCEFDRFLICWLRDLTLFRKRYKGKENGSKIMT